VLGQDMAINLTLATYSYSIMTIMVCLPSLKKEAETKELDTMLSLASMEN
jgi:hypothetical protein